MQQKDAQQLLKKYLAGNCTPDEKAMLETWYFQQEGKDLPEITDAEANQAMAEVWARMPINRQHHVRTLWPRIAAAVAVILITSAGMYFYNREPVADQQISLVKQDVRPGGNKAYLTLANGSRIILNDAKNGVLAQQTGISIAKTGNGQLVYSVSNSNHNPEAPEYNKVETPKGGQYQVILPDGSHVWLNAASSLRYPASFATLKDRKVELTGEAYFEVAKDKQHPFLVVSNRQEVKVLGTHFNINAYADEPSTKTTLEEGSVQLNDQTILKPGEQASLTPTGEVQVRDADVDIALAWKNGKFVFEREDLASVMRMLSRWYDVEVIYQDNFKGKTFTGSISRYDNISKILDKITFIQGIHFKIEGRRITAMK